MLNADDEDADGDGLLVDEECDDLDPESMDIENWQVTDDA